MAQSRLSRVTGYEPLRISGGVKRGIASALLSLPMALIATAISDGTTPYDPFNYVFSPGTPLAFRFVKVEPSHRGLGAFFDVLSAYAQTMELAFIVNAIFYGLLIFGFMTIGQSRSKRRPF